MRSIFLILLAASSAIAAPPSPPKVVHGNKPTSAVASAIKGDSAQSKEPLLIRSDSFQLDSKSRVFYYRDNVEVVKGDMTITSDVMIGKYDEKNQLKEMICENNVVITRGDRLRTTSNRAVYDVVKDVIVLTEGPELNDRGNVLTADRVTLYVKEDRSEADGHVRVKVIKSEGQGDLMSSIKKGKDKKSE